MGDLLCCTEKENYEEKPDIIKAFLFE